MITNFEKMQECIRNGDTEIKWDLYCEDYFLEGYLLNHINLISIHISSLSLEIINHQSFLDYLQKRCLFDIYKFGYRKITLPKEMEMNIFNVQKFLQICYNDFCLEEAIRQDHK